jgi:hypothetical protein
LRLTKIEIGLFCWFTVQKEKTKKAVRKGIILVVARLKKFLVYFK